MLDMRARFGRKTERFVDAESSQENLFPNMESEDPTTKDTAPEDIENIVTVDDYAGGCITAFGGSDERPVGEL